jgi:hypothetical protein
MKNGMRILLFKRKRQGDKHQLRRMMIMKKQLLLFRSRKREGRHQLKKMMITKKQLLLFKSRKLEGMKLQSRNRRREEQQQKSLKKHLNHRLTNQQKLQ